MLFLFAQIVVCMHSGCSCVCFCYCCRFALSFTNNVVTVIWTVILLLNWMGFDGEVFLVGVVLVLPTVMCLSSSLGWVVGVGKQ